MKKRAVPAVSFIFYDDRVNILVVNLISQLEECIGIIIFYYVDMSTCTIKML